MNEKIYQTLSVVFCVLVVLSNIVSTKLFPSPVFPHLALSSSLIIYPFTFVISDLVNEIFGAKKARHMVFLGFFMCILTQCVILLMLLLPSHQINNQAAIESVFHLSQIALFSSMIAYMVGQVLDIYLYNSIHEWTGDKHLWLRSNMSSLISQAYDTLCVTSLFYYFGVHLPTGDIVKILIISFLFKASITSAMTPLLYQCVRMMKKNRHSSINMAHEYQ